jgi:hypothetical protein
LNQDQQYPINPHPPEKPRVLEGKPDEQQPGHERNGAEHHGKEITDITGSIIKPDLYFSGLPANRALFIHFGNGMELVWIWIGIDATLPASGAFIG